MIPVVRLLECAKRDGGEAYLWNLAHFTAAYVRRTEEVECATTTKMELLEAFWMAVTWEQPHGGPLWNVSTKRHKNKNLFWRMMEYGMKEKWPRAKLAIRILEVANEKGWLNDLAMFVSEEEKSRRARHARLDAEELADEKSRRYWSW
jgi:hypothetical protein